MIAKMRPLDAAMARLTPEQARILERLESFEAPFLEPRLVGSGKPFGTPEEFGLAFVEWKKFAFLSVVGGRGLAMVNQTIDQVWHELVLSTREYRHFCQEVLGRQLDHRPRDPNAPTATDGIRTFEDAYVAMFGPLPPIWKQGSGQDENAVCDDDCRSGSADDEDVSCVADYVEFD